MRRALAEFVRGLRKAWDEGPRPKTLDQMIGAAAEKYGLDPELVAAVVHVESGGNRWAYRYETDFQWVTADRPRGVTRTTELQAQKTSWGLMQVMGATARDMGCDAPYLSCLCNPEVGLDYGCRYLRKQLDRYNGSVEEAVAAYNAGSARRAVDGSFLPESTERHVRRVMATYRARRPL